MTSLASLYDSSNKDPESECLQTMWKCWITIVPPKVEIKPHVHKDHEQIYYLIKGSGIILVSDEKAEVKAGDCIYLPSDIPHGFITTVMKRLKYSASAQTYLDHG
ncbi:MAG: cupin domain-containing protein [Candidatus Bathyarchaeia archaeon]